MDIFETVCGQHNIYHLAMPMDRVLDTLEEYGNETISGHFGLQKTNWHLDDKQFSYIFHINHPIFPALSG